MVNDFAQLSETADALHSAAVKLVRRARTVDAGMDLDGPRASLLSVLVFVGPQTVSRLAELEQVSPPAITKLVNALESAGLAFRERAADDGRVVVVAATPAGRRLLRRGRAARVREVERLLGGVSPRDLATLRRAADILLSIVERLQ